MPISGTNPPLSRRSLLKGAAGLGAAAATASVFLPPNVRRALASTGMPRPGEGSINDIEHVVFLMQENRSFDEYFGTFPAVRGFGDPSALTLAGGNSVFAQPDPGHADGYLLPFHMDTATTSAQATPGLAHGWSDQHAAWSTGRRSASASGCRAPSSRRGRWAGTWRRRRSTTPR
jgi:phospholipase C